MTYFKNLVKETAARKIRPIPEHNLKELKQDYPFGEEVVKRLNAAVKTNLTLGDYYEWMEPHNHAYGSFPAFDNAVLKFLGKKAYLAGEAAARLPYLLEYALKIPGAKEKEGGISLKAILEANK